MIRVITGHICSGKSTFVSNNAKPGDAVIDMDAIALALCPAGTTHHSYSDAIRSVARAARSAAIAEAIRQHEAQAIENVWIIHAYPTADDLAGYRRRGYQVIDIACDAAELIERAGRSRPPHLVDELARRLEAPRVRRITRRAV